MENNFEFISVEFKDRKKRNPLYSLRAFAKFLELSPAQLSQVMNGKRPLTAKAVKKIASKLGYSPKKIEKMLIDSLRESNSLDKKTDKLNLEEDKFRTISDWYHLSMLSLIRLAEVKSDPRWIANKLGISVQQVSDSIKRLERLNIISTKPFLQQISDPLEVTSDVPSEAIRKYHKQNLDLAKEKIETVSNSLREYQSISIPISLKSISKYKKLIDEMMSEAVLMSKNNGLATEVYHLNAQFFPVTKLNQN
ncbi:MAG: TIGR02147 family protein [Bdellovibrionota bacterium]